MSYEKQTWNKYDDMKTEEENIQNGAVVTDNRMNHIEEGIKSNDRVNSIQTQSINKHIADTANPHQVTALQVGAYSKKESDEKLSIQRQVIDSHIINKANPHVVTASQVGAYSKKESDTKFATAQSVNNLSTALKSKAEDSNVVHKTGDETISGKKSFSDEVSVKYLKFPTSTTSVTLGAGISISLERRGEMVIGIITGTINSSLTSKQQFGVGAVPYGFRPNKTVNIPVHMTSSWNESHIDIGTDGKGTWWGASTNSGYPRGTQMWFTDDALPT